MNNTQSKMTPAERAARISHIKESLEAMTSEELNFVLENLHKIIQGKRAERPREDQTDEQ